MRGNPTSSSPNQKQESSILNFFLVNGSSALVCNILYTYQFLWSQIHVHEMYRSWKLYNLRRCCDDFQRCLKTSRDLLSTYTFLMFGCNQQTTVILVSWEAFINEWPHDPPFQIWCVSFVLCILNKVLLMIVIVFVVVIVSVIVIIIIIIITTQFSGHFP